MGRWCSIGREARQAWFIRMWNVSAPNCESTFSISNKSQRWRWCLSVLADGKCLLDRQTLRYPLPPRRAQQWRMECTKGVCTSGPQGRTVVEVKQTRLVRCKPITLCTVTDSLQISISRLTLLPIILESLLQPVRLGVRQSRHKASLILLSKRPQMLFRVENVPSLRFRE
jgi:hypothetical protein